MKSLIFPMGILFAGSAIANVNYPCSGAPGAYRTNPDSTPGGYVATSATIDCNV